MRKSEQSRAQRIWREKEADVIIAERMIEKFGSVRAKDIAYLIDQITNGEGY